MKLTNLLFKDSFKVSADYVTMVTFFKSGLNERYFKGFIDKDETQLFYYSDFFSRSFSPSLPVIQINFKNQVDTSGQIEIKFRLVSFALIAFGLVNGLILLFSIVNSDKINTIPLLAAISFLVFSYGFLLFYYRSALTGFKKEIKNSIIQQ